MSDPKTTADLARALDPILYPHLNPLTQGWQRLMQITLQVRTVFQADGWVSPEEHQAAVYDEHEKHIDAVKRAEKAEDAHQTALAQLSEAVDIIARVEALEKKLRATDWDNPYVGHALAAAYLIRDALGTRL